MDWRADSIDLLQRLDVTFQERPLYVVAAEDVPGILPGGCCGITGALLDRRLKPHLPEWCGPGFACIVDAERFDGPYDGDKDAALVNAVVHEAAHYIAGGLREQQAFDDERAGPTMLAALWSFDFGATPIRLATDVEPWHQHGAEFIRAVLHLKYRAWTLCRRMLWLDSLCVAGPQYGLSDPRDYLAALGNEPERCIDAPLLDVIDSPAPAAFVELFRKDTTRG